MPEEVSTTRHFGNNLVDAVGPSQSVSNKHSKKLVPGDLLNLRTREVDVKGW